MEASPLRRALAAAALLACILAPGAEAHFGTGKLGYRSTIRAVKPRVNGVQLKVLYGDDQVWLDNRSGETIVIDGYGGEPYLRFAPEGIFVNVNSPAGYLNQDRYGKSAVPKSASAKAPPNWQKLAGGKVWAWHDHRIHYMSPLFPPKVRAAPRKPHHVFDWKVPATADGKRFFDQRQPRLQAAAAAEPELPGRPRHRARCADRRRDGRPLLPAPRDPPLSGVESSTLPSARRMSSTLTSISSPSR